MFRLLVLVFLLLRVFAEDLTTEQTMVHEQMYKENDGYLDGLQDYYPYLNEKEIHAHKNRNHVARLVSDVVHHDHKDEDSDSHDHSHSLGRLIVLKDMRIHKKMKHDNFHDILHYLRERQLAEHTDEVSYDKHHGAYHRDSGNKRHAENAEQKADDELVEAKEEDEESEK